MPYYSNKLHHKTQSRNRWLLRSSSKLSETRRFPARNYDDQLRKDPTYNNSESRCLGIFGLNTFTTRDTLYEMFSTFGPIEHIQMVNFNNTFISRGFCFLYFKNLSDARFVKSACNNIIVDGHRIRADYSFTKRGHTPTPGVYMGRPSRISIAAKRSRNSRSPYPNRRHRDRSPSSRRCMQCGSIVKKSEN